MNLDFMFILYAFVICLGLNLIFFIVAFLLKTDAFTDITYALTFLITVTVFLAWQQQTSVIQILIYLAVVLWAFRLGGYLFLRILKMKKDGRFDQMRDHFWKFFMFWILQAISVFIIVLPASCVLNIDQHYFDDQLGWTYVFFALAILALLFESVGDWQKNHYYNHRERYNTPFVNFGLWKITRHPNYFGEISFWWMLCGFFLTNFLTTNADNHQLYYHIFWLLSPLYILILINFVSGVPMLEVRSWDKLGQDQNYQEYIRKTSCIIPFIGKKGNIYKVKHRIKQKS